MTAPRYEKITDLWPEPPTTMIERLRHTLDVWADYPDDYIVLIATSEVYGPHVQTGLTIGDLKELFRRTRDPGPNTVLYGSAADQMRERLRKDVAEHGKPPGDPNQP
jgi:hypothetical protein